MQYLAGEAAMLAHDLSDFFSRTEPREHLEISGDIFDCHIWQEQKDLLTSSG